MIIVAGKLTVAADQRAQYLQGCTAVVAAARDTPGCLDFSLAADLLDPGRINVFERWDTRRDLEAFRGEGPSGEQRAELLAIDVAEYELEQ